jgi:hypothetical protein
VRSEKQDNRRIHLDVKSITLVEEIRRTHDISGYYRQTRTSLLTPYFSLKTLFHFTVLPPLTLYIHLPWCVRKCPYCDFNSHQVKDAVPEQAYVEALIADLEQDLPLVWGRTLEAIFIGGGTPSLFSPAAIDRLLGAVRARLPDPAPRSPWKPTPAPSTRNASGGFARPVSTASRSASRVSSPACSTPSDVSTTTGRRSPPCAPRRMPASTTSTST